MLHVFGHVTELHTPRRYATICVISRGRHIITPLPELILRIYYAILPMADYACVTRLFSTALLRRYMSTLPLLSLRSRHYHFIAANIWLSAIGYLAIYIFSLIIFATPMPMAMHFILLLRRAAA